MAQRKSLKNQPETPAAATQREAEVRKMMDESIALPSDMSNLSTEDILEIERMYRLSAPIRIPKAKLNPDYSYRWVSLESKNYRKRRGIGYQPVTQQLLEDSMALVKIEELAMGTHFETDGTLRIGTDLIFMFIPRRVIDTIIAARTKAHQDAMRAGKQRFHQAGEISGVETFDKFSG